MLPSQIMGANLYWEPTKRKKHDIGVGAPQSFMDALEKAFGSRTPRLGEEHVPVLRGIAAGYKQADVSVACDELIEAIWNNDEIQISVEY